jgi:hypothetical protein
MIAIMPSHGQRPATPQSRQLTFTWLPDKTSLKISEIAAATGMERTYLEEYFAKKCYRFPSDTDARRAMRVPRAFVIELLVTSAEFTADEKRDAVAATFPEFDLQDLLTLRAQLDAVIKRKS